MKKMKKISCLFLLSLLLIGCTHKSSVTQDSSVVAGYSGASEQMGGDPTTLPAKPPVRIMPVPQTRVMPDATAFRMSGNYSQNVAVTLDADGNLIYFPDPADLTADSEPIELGEGWWLNRQGLGQHSVFTKYTFAEYAALPEAPAASQLKKMIIPGARVTQFVELPYKIGEVEDHLEEVKSYLKDL